MSIAQVLWLTPVIPAIGRLRQVDHLKSEVQDQLGQHGPSLLKIQKISQVHRWVFPATWEAKAGESLEP